METYNIVCKENNAEIIEEEGEVIFINDVAIGVSAHSHFEGDNPDDLSEKPYYNVTHLETGCLICKDIESKEMAIGIATKRITASYWADSINKCVEQLKINKIGYPVNDIEKFKK